MDHTRSLVGDQRAQPILKSTKFLSLSISYFKENVMLSWEDAHESWTL